MVKKPFNDDEKKGKRASQRQTCRAPQLFARMDILFVVSAARRSDSAESPVLTASHRVCGELLTS